MAVPRRMVRPGDVRKSAWVSPAPRRQDGSSQHLLSVIQSLLSSSSSCTAVVVVVLVLDGATDALLWPLMVRFRLTLVQSNGSGVCVLACVVVGVVVVVATFVVDGNVDDDGSGNGDVMVCWIVRRFLLCVCDRETEPLLWLSCRQCKTRANTCTQQQDEKPCLYPRAAGRRQWGDVFASNRNVARFLPPPAIP